MTLKEMRQSQVQIKYESQNEKRRSQRRRQGCVIYLIHPLWQLSGWPSLLVYCLAAHQRGSHGLVRVIIQMDSPGQTMAWIISDKIPPIHDSSTDSLSMPTDLPGSARVSSWISHRSDGTHNSISLRRINSVRNISVMIRENYYSPPVCPGGSL